MTLKIFCIRVTVILLKIIHKFTISQKQGLITLLPKSGKDTHYLKNWRPISLLMVDNKILASTLATRVKTELRNLINDDQRGFVKGRYIGENIRKVLEIIEYSEIEDKPGPTVIKL